MKQFLIPKLISLTENEISVLKRGSSYLSIQFEMFRFVDIINYVGPGFSLAVFLKSFNAPVEKGYFPYEAVTCVADLDNDFVPPKEAFDSTLKGSSLTQQEYDEGVVQVWRDQGMQNWHDLLVYYNKIDVVPALVAVKNYENQFPG